MYVVEKSLTNLNTNLDGNSEIFKSFFSYIRIRRDKISCSLHPLRLFKKYMQEGSDSHSYILILILSFIRPVVTNK